MKCINKAGIIASFCLATALANAGTFKIAGYTFDEANVVRSAAVVDGPVGLKDHPNEKFARYSEEFIENPSIATNNFRNFARVNSLGRMMDRGHGSDAARHISLPEPGEDLPFPNINRCTVELTWGTNGVSNLPGEDVVIYESGSYEGFSVAVRKAGSMEFSPYRYQFANTYDKIHNANAVAFDFSKFGIAENEVISAVRIRNLFNSRARIGGDKVDDASGQGSIIYPIDPRYKQAFMLKNKPDGEEFKVEQLGSDIIYVVALSGVVPLPTPAATAPAPQTEQKPVAENKEAVKTVPPSATAKKSP